jgi:poly-gamma-glutamate capsule biosynthesis protein CapA/YwtB (metallophosphatase superfamily)
VRLPFRRHRFKGDDYTASLQRARLGSVALALVSVVAFVSLAAYSGANGPTSAPTAQVAGVTSRPEAPQRSPLGEPCVAGPTGQESAITWVGDTLLADAAVPSLESHGYDWAFAGLGSDWAAGYVVANLEGPLTTITTPYDPTQKWNYAANPAAARAISCAGIDAVSLANNHAMDRGPGGLEDTIRNARGTGIATFGGGANRAEAELPLLVRTTAGLVAILAFDEDYGAGERATDMTPGSIPGTKKAIERGYQLAKAAGATRVIGFVHWGDNYLDVVPAQRAMAAIFAATGYDFVIGSGPHVVQPIEVVDGMPVAFSIGNFVMGTPGRWTETATGVGLVLTTRIDSSALQIEARCIAVDNGLVLFQPTSCSAMVTSETMNRVNSSMQVASGVGHLTLPLKPAPVPSATH